MKRIDNKSPEITVGLKTETKLLYKQPAKAMRFFKKVLMNLIQMLNMQNKKLNNVIYAEHFNFASSGYFTLSKEGEIVDLNQYGSQILGEEYNYLIRSNFSFYVSFDSKLIFLHFLENIFSSNNECFCELTLISSGVFPLHVRLNGFVTVKNEQCLVHVTNTIECRQTEFKLLKTKQGTEEGDKLKSAFLQNISHEIRTPMNAIIGFSTLLEKSNLPDCLRTKYTNLVINNTKQLLSVVTDILTISSLETKQEKVCLSRIGINKMLIELLNMLNKQANKPNIIIRTKLQLTNQKSNILIDKTKVIHILTNLIINAFRFTSHGFIEIGYSIKNSMIEFYVKDTGIGIKEEMHELIFKPFRQSDEKFTKEYGGIGLGLSISKAFIELLGGSIWLRSEPNKGSIFYFTIPYIPDNNTDNSETSLIKVENETSI